MLQYHQMIAEDKEENELSRQYFSKCPDLQFVEEPFELKNGPEEVKRRDLVTQFELIRALTETKRHKGKLRSNTIVQNKKNRYPEQSIFEHSRVLLPEVQESEDNYINANYIPLFDDKKVIITQGPLESTQEAFEQMLRKEKVQCVVMLCNVIQNGKVRCFDYCQNRDKQIVRQISDYAIIQKVTFEIVEKLGREKDQWEKDNEEKENYTYTHIHYSEWPDRGLPFEPRQLRQVVLEALQFDNIVIHCSAGLGRSGVMAAVLLLQLKALVGNKFSVFETVRRLRQYRYGAVQNNEQYKFIYEYLCELSKEQQ